MKIILLIFSVLISAQVLHCQLHYTQTNYTAKDGLSQNTVMDIIQDKEGFMWFATWDGLNKFDGYSFQSYKVKPGDGVRMSNSRIDKIVEDAYGYIWCLTYGKDVIRFNPYTEEFKNCIPENIGQYKYSNLITDIICLQDSSIWLKTRKDGVLKTNFITKDSVQLQLYSVKNGSLPNDIIHHIHSDKDHHYWILTDNGIHFINNQKQTETTFFSEKEGNTSAGNQSFYSYFEANNEIWFGSKRGRLWKYQKKSGKFTLMQLPTQALINGIYKRIDGSYFFSTYNDGFYVYSSGDEFTHFCQQNNTELPTNFIKNSYLANNGDIWLFQTIKGITRFTNDNKISFYPNENEIQKKETINSENFIHEDRNGYIWLHTPGAGLSHFDPATEKITPLYKDSINSEPIFSKHLHSVFSDKQGNLWFCPRSKQLCKISFSNAQFQKITSPIKSNNKLWNEARGLFCDSKNRIWISNKSGITNIYDHKLKYLGYLTNTGHINTHEEPFSGVVYCMAEDEDAIWLGCKGAGIVRLNEISTNSFKLKSYTYNSTDVYSLSNDNVYHIYFDDKQRMWIATFGGGVNLVIDHSTDKLKFINHRNNLSAYPISTCYRARYITSDYDHNICIGTTNGILICNDDFVEPTSISFKHYTYQINNDSCLSNNDVHFILVSKKHQTYLGTFGGGLNVMKDTNTKPYFTSSSKEDGLPSDILLAALEDRHNNLWMSTENGLTKYSPATNTLENFDETNIGYPVLFSEGGGIRDHQGYFYFATKNGTVRFHPDSISQKEQATPIAFTSLKIFNKKVSPQHSSILTEHINFTKELILNYKNNSFSIGYASLEMKSPQKIQYAYKLDGFEKEWNYVLNKREANYTNIHPGDYTLLVKSTNNAGVWSQKTRKLPIKILPSFWDTPIAYTVYVILFFGIIGIIVYILFFIYQLKNRLKVENELTEMKLHFFTDISHELRTPLTLISAPIEQVLNDPKLSPENRSQIQLVDKNAKRMLQLITQILDFAKLRKNKMKMHVEQIEVIKFILQLKENFQPIAEQNKISYQLKSELDSFNIWADKDKLEKIFFNLLSNAFKYLNGGNQVSIDIKEQTDVVAISVEDNGSGIHPKLQGHLFNRFENWVEKSSSAIPSSGIGLSIVKELVELHKGEIQLESKEGVGTKITILLKKGLHHFENDVDIIIDESIDNFSLPQHQFSELKNIEPSKKESDEKPSILLVEDNTDVRTFIANLLHPHYSVIEAQDGQQALELINQEIPDLIISDLMMPNMDGMELLSHIRKNISSSHIPFIILSAKSAVENQLSGFEKGADAYVTKPFSTSYLLSRVKSLLFQQQRIQEFYQNNTSQKTLSIEPDVIEVTSLDKQFMDALHQLLEKNIDNSNLVIDDLAEEMAMSRSVLFKKLKTLSGMSPVEFIKSFRLKRAAQLITDSEYSMTQISYMVGINDSRYFSKCFKTQYGVTPTQYRSKNSNKIEA